MFRHATLGDTLYFWFALNATTGSGGDGASPAFDVRQGGAAASAAPVMSGTPDLLTHANYPDGCFEVAIVASSGNGFAAGNQYGVFCTAAISSVNPTGFIGGFALSPAVANVTQIAGQTANAAGAVTFPGTLASTTNITSASGVAVSSIGNNVITAASIASDAITAAKVAADVSAEIADQVWDEILSGHAGVGSAGAALSAAGGSGDPWATALPGAYGAGTAGNIIGNRIDAAITSRMASYTQPTGFLSANFTTGIPVSSIANNAITAAAINAGALNGKGDWLLSTSNGSGFTSIPWNASWDPEVQSECADALTAFGVSTLTQANVRTAVGLASANLDTQLGDLPTNSELTTALAASWTTTLTEGYAANGAQFTPAQGLYAIHQYLMDFAITTTDYSVKKLDGSTAFSVTLNSATTPTAATRS